MYHFVHLAEDFVVIQWSGRHDNRKARNKMIRSKDVQIGGQEPWPALRISRPGSIGYSRHLDLT